MTFYDILSGAGILMAVIAAALMVQLALRVRAARVPLLLIGAFCVYAAGFYCYILAIDPVLGTFTAALGRTVVIVLLAGIIMLRFMWEK